MAELSSTRIYGDLNVTQATHLKNSYIVGELLVNGNAVYHTGNKPTNDDVGLGNVTNVAQAAASTSITAGNGLSGGGTLAATRTITLGTPSTITNSTTNSVTATSHTHALTVTKADVGLSNVANVDTTNASNLGSGTVPVARLPAAALIGDTTYTAGTGITLSGTVFSLTDERFTSALLSKLNGIAAGAQVNTITSVAGKTGAVTLTGDDVGLSNVSNVAQAAASTSITAGNGLSGGGTLAATRTITLGTPSTITGSSTNSVTTTSHSHALTLTAGDIPSLPQSNITNLTTDLADKVSRTGDTLTGKLTLEGVSTTTAPLNIPNNGTANPTSTVNGDIWFRSNTLFFNNNGTARQVAHTSSWSTITQAEAESSTSTTARFISGQRLHQGVAKWWNDNAASLNAGTATKLATTVKINGIDFDGSSDITTPSGPSNSLLVKDTRAIGDRPMDVPEKAISADFKTMLAAGNPPVRVNNDHAHVLTVAGWSSHEFSGGAPTQLSIGTGGISYRYGVTPEVWSGWTRLSTPGDPIYFGGTGNDAAEIANQIPAGAERTKEVNNGNGMPIAGWGFIKTIRHSNGSSMWGTQHFYGWESNANRMWVRNISNGSYSGWLEVLTNNGHTFAGNLNMSGNVSGYSDERLKKDWLPLHENFVERLANVRSGSYTRTDVDLEQVGVSAQNLREILPQAVLTDEEGYHSVVYGNAALVSAVELAKEVVALKHELSDVKAELAELRDMVKKLTDR